MKPRIVDAGTKYLAISFSLLRISTVCLLKDFLADDAKQAFVIGSKTPEPEFPVVATSAIKVENLVRHVNGNICGETMCDCVPCPASTTMTGSPGQAGASHNCICGSSVVAGSFFSSINNRLKSTSSAEPCFKTFASKSTPAM